MLSRNCRSGIGNNCTGSPALSLVRFLRLFPSSLLPLLLLLLLPRRARSFKSVTLPPFHFFTRRDESFSLFLFFFKLASLRKGRKCRVKECEWILFFFSPPFAYLSIYRGREGRKIEIRGKGESRTMIVVPSARIYSSKIRILPPQTRASNYPRCCIT